jgi:hypothetical protein
MRRERRRRKRRGEKERRKNFSEKLPRRTRE